jgi:phage FluMu protein Com
MIMQADILHYCLICHELEMNTARKKKANEARLSGGEIRIEVGFRLYELFCADCNRVLIEEDPQLMRLQCTECKRIYAYRLHPEEEEYIFQVSGRKVSIQ